MATKISLAQCSSADECHRAHGIDPDKVLLSRSGDEIHPHVQLRGRQRYGLSPVQTVAVIDQAIPTGGCSVNPESGLRTQEHVAFIPQQGKFVRVLSRPGHKIVVTMLHERSKSEPGLRAINDDHRCAAIEAAVPNPHERPWHEHAAGLKVDLQRCCMLVAHTIDDETNALVKTNLGAAPIALDATFPDQLELETFALAHCLQRFRRNPIGRKSRAGYLTLELGLWGVRKTLVDLSQTEYADAYAALGLSFNYAFSAAKVLQSAT